MEAYKPNRKRKEKENCKETKLRKTGSSIKQEFNKVQNEKEGLNGKFLEKIMSKRPNFIGVYPQDFLNGIKITKLPISLIVNIDMSNQSGSHWIAIYINQKTVEVYDSLDLNTKYWQRKPRFLYKFLSRFRKTHKYRLTPRLQSENSQLCGFFCLFFLLYRKKYNFEKCLSVFTSHLSSNENILISHLCKL